MYIFIYENIVPTTAGHEPYMSSCCCYMVKIKQYTKNYIE